MDQTNQDLDMKKDQTQAGSMSLEDPIQELELQVNKNDKDDYEEVMGLLTNYLSYPSAELAQLYMDCNRLGERDLKKDEEDVKQLKTKGENEVGEQAQYCPYSGFIKQEDYIKLCTRLKNINNIGISTFLYFQTVKNVGILLLIMALVYSIYALVTNLIAAGNFDPDNFDFDASVGTLSISLAAKEVNQTEENKNYYYVSCWLGVATVILWCLIIFVLKYFQVETEVQVGEETVSAADFTIVIQNIPLDITKQQLQSQLNDYYESITNIPAHFKRPLTIAKYNVGKPFYMLEDALVDDEVKELKEQHKQMIELFASWIEERQGSASFSTTKEQREKQYKAYEELVQKMGEKFAALEEKAAEEMKKENDDTTTTAFVTFETSFAKETVAQLNDPGFLAKIRYYITCCQGGNRFKLLKSDGSTASISIEKAPEPEDIIWKNIGFPDFSLILRKIFTYFITFLLLGLSFAAVYGLSIAQVENTENTLLSLAISVIISLINVILGQVIRALTVLEKDYTDTKHQASLGFKSVFAQLINSILVPMVVSYFIKQQTFGQSIYAQNGLASDVFMLGITNAFISPILKIFDPGFIINRLLKWLKSSPNRRLTSNQEDLNQTYAYIIFEPGYEYIYVVNLYLFTCFFVSLQPIIAYFSIAGVLTMYWAQKYSLFNRMRRPVPGTDVIHLTMFQLIYLGGIVYSLGSLTWSNFLPGGAPENALLPNLIALGVSVLTALLPYRAIFTLAFEDEQTVCLEYQKSRILLSSEYDRLNPNTAKEGLQDYMNFIEKEQERMKNASDDEKKELFAKLAKQQARGQSFQPQGPPIMPFMPPQRQMNFMPPPQMMGPQMSQVPPGFQPPPPVNPGPPGFQAPPPVNPGPPGFQAPPPTNPYQRPPPGFGGPTGYRPPGFGAPPPGFGGPGFRPPPPGFQQRPPGFGPPGFQPGFRPPPPGFQQPPGFRPYR